MTAGVSTTVADAMLGVSALSGSGGDCIYAALAIGDPGSAGTTNPSSVTTRESVTWGSPSAAAVAASNEPEWSSWAGTSPETEEYITLWSASSSGTFGASMQLSATVTMETGDSLTLTEIQVTIPVAS
jgi:hypothetical protein